MKTLTRREVQGIERDILARIDKAGGRLNMYTVIGKGRRKEWKTAQVLRTMLERRVLEHKDFRGLEVGRKVVTP